MIEYIKKPNTDKELLNILNPLVKKWFLSKFKSFCPPQKYGIMRVHSRENILISSPTGSGKTLTSFLAILNELVDSSIKGILEDKIYCIYISPLKALSSDIQVNLLEPLAEIEALFGKKLGIRVGVRTGDTPQNERQKMLKNPPHILITTPESLALMLSAPKFKDHLTSVSWAIIDEIHALAENKRGTHLALCLEMLEHLSGELTRVGLSATISPLEEIAKFLVGSNRNCLIADIETKKEIDIKVISPVKDLVNSDFNTIQSNIYHKLHELIKSHKTTLIFTNTRAATERVVHSLRDKFPGSYYEIEENPPFKHSSLIGAHHGSLSKEHRQKIEQKLRDGKLKAVACSTSLELGIDIGSIDLVVLLGSPKSVARATQRIGRAGHRLSDITKARILVTDRDDLIECSVILKDAIEKKIDRIHIPKNALDVLVQFVLGFVLVKEISFKELFDIVRECYTYKDLSENDFLEIVKYLAGDFKNLENKNIFAKIYFDNYILKKRGRMTRVIYATNIGTIPQAGGVTVKVGNYPVGTIDEGFLEKLTRGDTFVLGGDVYLFKFARGMTAQVAPAYNKTPTVPRWASEMLPLSFDLACDVQSFRSNIFSKFKEAKSKKEIINWIHNYLYVDDVASEAIYSYTKEQYLLSKKKENYFPTKYNLVVEKYVDYIFERDNSAENNKKTYYIFHSLNGRKANQALSRVFAHLLGKYHHKDVEIGVNDNGFYLASNINLEIKRIIDLVEAEEFDQILELSLEGTEIIRRRFRNCAQRSLMILKNYKGKTKNLGRQQVNSQILIKAVEKISKDFVILKEARREVAKDVMDSKNAKKVFEKIKQNVTPIKIVEYSVPSPFATNLLLQGMTDIITIQDKHEFLQSMHKLVLAKIAVSKDLSNKEKLEVANKLRELNNLDSTNEIKEEVIEQKIPPQKEELIFLAKKLNNVSSKFIEKITKIILGEKVDEKIVQEIKKNQFNIEKKWPPILSDYLTKSCSTKFDYNKYWKEKEESMPAINYDTFWSEKEEKKKRVLEDKEFLLRKDFLYAFKRRETPPDVCDNIFDVIKFNSDTLSKKSRIYFDEEFKNEINKVWSDKTVKFVRKKLRNN